MKWSIWATQFHSFDDQLHIWNWSKSITYMKWIMKLIMKFHWKPLGKQWNGCCSISFKTLRKTMKWALLHLTITFINYIHRVGRVTNVMKLYRKPLGLQYNYIIAITLMKCEMPHPRNEIVCGVMTSISLKTLRKTMKWGLLNFIENP